MIKKKKRNMYMCFYVYKDIVFRKLGFLIIIMLEDDLRNKITKPSLRSAERRVHPEGTALTVS